MNFILVCRPSCINIVRSAIAVFIHLTYCRSRKCLTFIVGLCSARGLWPAAERVTRQGRYGWADWRSHAELKSLRIRRRKIADRAWGYRSCAVVRSESIVFEIEYLGRPTWIELRCCRNCSIAHRISVGIGYPRACGIPPAEECETFTCRYIDIGYLRAVFKILIMSCKLLISWIKVIDINRRCACRACYLADPAKVCAWIGYIRSVWEYLGSLDWDISDCYRTGNCTSAVIFVYAEANSNPWPVWANSKLYCHCSRTCRNVYSCGISHIRIRGFGCKCKYVRKQTSICCRLIIIHKCIVTRIKLHRKLWWIICIRIAVSCGRLESNRSCIRVKWWCAANRIHTVWRKNDISVRVFENNIFEIQIRTEAVCSVFIAEIENHVKEILCSCRKRAPQLNGLIAVGRLFILGIACINSAIVPIAVIRAEAENHGIVTRIAMLFIELRIIVVDSVLIAERIFAGFGCGIGVWLKGIKNLAVAVNWWSVILDIECGIALNILCYWVCIRLGLIR